MFIQSLPENFLKCVMPGFYSRQWSKIFHSRKWSGISHSQQCEEKKNENKFPFHRSVAILVNIFIQIFQIDARNSK